MFASVESTQPAASISAPPRSRLRSLHRFLIRQCTRFIDVWYSVQLAHYGGKYSIERMLALEEYTRNTSIARVLAVTFGAPLLVIVLLLCQESVPLQDPADGWKVNYGFWVRVGLIGVGVGNAAAIQVGFWLDIPPLTFKQVITYCALMAAGYIAAGMAITSLWLFPIPFYMFTLSLPVTLLVVMVARLVVGAETFRQILCRREQLRRLNKVGSVQAIMYIIYPVYQLAYGQARSTPYEMPVLLVLPVIRLVLKMVFASAASHKEDMTPAQVVFTVDFFDSYYFATFIQTASGASLAAVMAVDCVQTASEMLELRQHTRKVLARYHRLSGEPKDASDNLLCIARAMCNSPASLKIQQRSNIKVRSCTYHELSEESRTLLRKIDTSSCTGSCLNSFQHNLKRFSASVIEPKPLHTPTKAWYKSCFRKPVAVGPLPPAITSLASPTIQDIPKGAKQKNKSRVQGVENASDILEKALEVLFTSECLVLSEYMEAIVPLIYGMFVLVVANTSSSEYHTDLVGFTHDKLVEVVSIIFAYALLEFGSFVVFAWVKKTTCGISALHQLAFVLETQALFVQSTLMMWILMTLPYRVTHFGCDFSFKFEWIGLDASAE